MTDVGTHEHLRPVGVLTPQVPVRPGPGYAGYCPYCGQYRARVTVTRPRRRRRRVLRRLAKSTAVIAIVGLAATGVLFAITPSAGQATTLAQAQAQADGISWPGPPVPARFAQALIATEDHRFYSEPGIDPIALGRVLVAEVTGGPDQGGSTIEFQLARMLYLPGRTGLTTEAELAALAVKLNFSYSKPEILQLYAEVVYFGQGYYGLQAAACGYFGRPPASLTIAQSALLAGLVNAPSADDPVVHPAAALAREQHVLGRMVASGYLTRAQANQALRQPLQLSQGRPEPGCPA